jgi:hypothetical protein
MTATVPGPITGTQGSKPAAARASRSNHGSVRTRVLPISISWQAWPIRVTVSGVLMIVSPRLAGMSLVVGWRSVRRRDLSANEYVRYELDRYEHVR